MIYQNLAFCRILHILFLLYLLNFVNSPLILIIFTFIIHLVNLKNNYMSNSKKYGLIIFDLSLIIIDLVKRFIRKDFNLYFIENISVFTIYNLLLILLSLLKNDDVSLVELHCKKLKYDDKRFYKESYFEYIKRVWSYVFLCK